MFGQSIWLLFAMIRGFLCFLAFSFLLLAFSLSDSFDNLKQNKRPVSESLESSYQSEKKMEMQNSRRDQKFR
jgi:hypothetical protein